MKRQRAREEASCGQFNSCRKRSLLCFSLLPDILPPLYSPPWSNAGLWRTYQALMAHSSNAVRALYPRVIPSKSETHFSFRLYHHNICGLGSLFGREETEKQPCHVPPTENQSRYSSWICCWSPSFSSSLSLFSSSSSSAIPQQPPAELISNPPGARDLLRWAASNAITFASISGVDVRLALMYSAGRASHFCSSFRFRLVW